MRRSWLALTTIGFLFTTACGPEQVAITVEIEVPDPDSEGTMSAALGDLELQIAPFNRDLIFDSLEAAFPTPEPEPPADLLAAQEEIAAAEADWRQAEDTWASARERQIQITQEMEGLNPAESRYLELYREFQELEGRVSRAERQKDQAFEVYTGLQEGFIVRKDSMQIVKDQWADEAFADYFLVVEAKLIEAGREMVVDTTDANGTALVDLPPGQGWVHARFMEAWSELYWNEPITVERGDPKPVWLTRENAKVRPIL
jgi:hypothetical protein